MLSAYTGFLAEKLCGGSSRKLIAGWWYSILVLSLILSLMSFLVLGSRPLSEGFAAFWSGMMVIGLCIGGTMIMRRFHNSMAVGFFMGSVVAVSQMFFMLFLVYLGLVNDEGVEQAANDKAEESGIKIGSFEEFWMAMFSLSQSILLGSFAAILAAHRSEILDEPGVAVMEMMDDLSKTGDVEKS